MHLAVWDIDPTQPAAPTRRESRLYDRLGSTSASTRKYSAGMAAYARIVRGWGVAYPEATEPTLVAALLACAEPTGWPSMPPAVPGTPTATAPSRRPNAARAPSEALRIHPGRAVAA